jgi:hypothetical protein
MELVKKTNNWANLPPLSELDLADRAMDWQDELELEIPRERLPDAVRRARKNHKSSFALNLYEILTAWEEITAEEIADRQKQLQRERFENPTLACSNEKYHVNKQGDVFSDLFNTGTDEVSPCPVCREDEYKKWRKTQIALYGEHLPTIIKPAQEFNTLEAAGNLFLAKLKPQISAEEIADLEFEHNSLVTDLVPDEKARRDLLIVWDEGARCFCSEQFRSQTFTPDVIRKKIEGYKKAVKPDVEKV